MSPGSGLCRPEVHPRCLAPWLELVAGKLAPSLGLVTHVNEDSVDARQHGPTWELCDVIWDGMQILQCVHCKHEAGSKAQERSFR
jgi:hypothetical protein